MVKTVYTKEYKLLCAWLVTERQSAGLTQAELAELLHRPQSYVSKYENGERRLDVLEFLEVVKALEANPSKIIMEIFMSLDSNK